MDTRSLYNQEQPQDLLSLNYNGVMGTKLFVEGQYSQRHLSFITSGAGATDLVNGTLLIDLSRGNAFRYWSPTFCVCNQDERDNSEMLGKATYFQSTGRRGTHTVVFGYNRYNDQRTADKSPVWQRLPHPRNLLDHSRGNDLPRVPEQQLHVHSA